ncbi:MAG TPA: tetratricopeptide repeat protein [Planctomycetota bacterium]|nr:tetratricopeptide repeat protein [Planctomycetota bacterium]
MATGSRAVVSFGSSMLLCAAAVVLTAHAQASDNLAAAPVPASSTAPVGKPEALTTAIKEIREGHPGDAQARLEVFLKDEPKKSPHRAEALYLLGQSLAAQNKLEEAKKRLDDAIDSTEDRTLKALAMFGRADCNLALRNFSLASRQYHWLETMYRDVKALPQDELMYKLGLACKNADARDTADYWFKQVIELYAHGPFAEKAKLEHSKYSPKNPDEKPRVYTLEVSSFGKREKAEAEAEILAEKGYRDVQIIETTVTSIPVFEVHIGKFGNKNDAIRAHTDADLAGLKTTIRPAIIEPIK